MGPSSKKTGVVALVAGGAVLALASASFACTVYAGKTTYIDGNAATADVVVEGAGSHAYCTTPTARGNIGGTGDVEVIKLKVNVNTSCATVSGAPLDNNVHSVRWIRDVAAVNTETANNCNTTAPQAGNPWVEVGTIAVTGGMGETTFALPPVVGPANLCVTSPVSTTDRNLTQYSFPMAFIDQI